MAGLEKEAEKVVKKAEGGLKKGSGGRTDGKKKGESSVTKAKRAARELLK
jgi:hypothetical protein